MLVHLFALSSRCHVEDNRNIVIVSAAPLLRLKGFPEKYMAVLSGPVPGSAFYILEE